MLTEYQILLHLYIFILNKPLYKRRQLCTIFSLTLTEICARRLSRGLNGFRVNKLSSK